MTARAIPIVALDVGNADEALRVARSVVEYCRFFKVGLELYTAEGPGVVRRLKDELGADIFLDLKLHDIPNTVAGAVKSARKLGVRLLTVHASGGDEMLLAAQDAADGMLGLLGVTVLTSMTEASLQRASGSSLVSIEDEVVRRSDAAAAARLQGIVCSGHEATAVRRAHPRLEILVPGIRLPDSASGDQRRVMTPLAAEAAGATYIVLGRAVTAAPNPREVMAQVSGQLGG